MADISDVFNALKSAILAALYPPTVTVGGTVTSGDVLRLTATSSAGAAIIGNYTVLPGDTTTSIAAALATAFTNAAGLLPPVTATASSTAISFANVMGAWTVAGSVTGTETLTVATIPANGISTLAGAKVEVGSGEPLANDLDAIAATTVLVPPPSPRALVSVYAAPAYGRNTTRYFEEWQVSVQPGTTLTAAIDATGTVVTLGGTVSVPQNVALLVGAPAAPKAYVYSVASGDTLASIAASLAALVNVDTPAVASGATVTIAAAHKLVARIGGVGSVVKELMRQVERIHVNFWCPSPELRDAVAKPVKPALSGTHFLLLADGTAARIITCGDYLMDEPEKAGLYRRLLMYDVEYGTFEAGKAAQIIAPQAQFDGASTALGTGATITESF